MGKGSLHRDVNNTSQKESREPGLMEQEQQTKGVGKESQLSRIAAAVNPGSSVEANTESTKSMIQTFVKHFDSVALDLIREMDDDQKDLVKNMVSEITKLQTKNIEEFEKAIGKIVGITNKMIESTNPKMQQLGQGLQDQAKEELFKAKGITLTGEKDTFANRLGREFGMNTEKESVTGVKGVGKLAKGFVSSGASGFKAGLKESFMPQGGMLDRILTTDEDKRQRELKNIEQTAGQTESESFADMFKKVVEQMLKGGKTDEKSSSPTTKSGNSESQEDTAGISKDAQIVALEKTAESNLAIQENSAETVDVLKQMLGLMKTISEKMDSMSQGGGGGGGGSMLDDALDIADNFGGNNRGGRRPRTVRGRARLARMKVKSFGRRSLGGIAKVGKGVLGGISKVGSKILGSGVGKALGFGAAAATGVGAANLIDDAADAASGTAKVADAATDTAKVVDTATDAAKVADTATDAAKVADTATDATKAGSAVGKVAEKEVAETAGKTVAKTAGKEVAKTAGKAVGKSILKKIPGVSIIAGLGFGAQRALEGDWLGAGGEVLSGLAGTVPGVGTAASVGIDAALAARDMGAFDGTAAGSPGNTGSPDSAAATQGQIEPAPKKEGFFARNKGKLLGAAALGGIGLAGAGLYSAYQGLTGGGETEQETQQGQIEPAKKEEPGFFARNKGMLMGAALGPAGMLTGSLFDNSSDNTETGKNIDGAIIEAGTEATKDKMQVNVPPPTVINQGGGGGGQSAPTITAPGGVGNVRSDDPTWLRFQQRRAVA